MSDNYLASIFYEKTLWMLGAKNDHIAGQAREKR